MTYSDYLALFLILPIGLLSVLVIHDRQRKQALPATFRDGSPPLVMTAVMLVAIAYTTPWDNHLIATHVWSYNAALVSGITIGVVPLEEFIFFALQPLLIGLWLFWLARRLPSAQAPADEVALLRLISSIAAACLWVIGLLLLAHWQPGTYLGWELAWAMPPIILQLSLAADMLWHYRRLLVMTVIPMVAYLSAADAVAIHQGIWTINRARSLGVLPGGQLPLEEFIFFFLTTIMVTFGLILVMALSAWWRVQAGLRQPASNTK